MRYGQSQYGLSRYAENTPTPEDLEKYFVDLRKYIPQEIYNLPEIKAVYDAQSVEIGSLLYYTDDIKKQFHIETATWGLIYWENKYAIETNFNLSYQERREIVKAKKAGQGTCTKKLIEDVASKFSGGEVNVIENTEPYEFTIQFIGIKGIPRNMQNLINAIEDIKPAHLDYKFKYTYTNWNYLDGKNLSFDKADNIAWDDLEIYD
ncbi:DUF2313 domain-containing protein [Clostridium botulinum]|nr:DUF2313 domain-containing protein [Clostridium botulinum]NFO92316.1 DUF2313 domain-containing protein [Clostridium botulinum]